MKCIYAVILLQQKRQRRIFFTFILMNDLLGGELNTFDVLAMRSPCLTHQPKCIQKLDGWCDATIIHEIPLFVPIYIPYLHLQRIYNNLDGHQSFYVALSISGIYRAFELLNQSENMYSWNFYKYIQFNAIFLQWRSGI